MKKSPKINEQVGGTFEVLCVTCKNKNNHKVLVSVETEGKETMGGDDWFHWNSDYQIIECQGCGSISFRQEYSDSESYDMDGYIKTELIYPKRTNDTWEVKNFFYVPWNLRTIHRETIDCFNNENLILCGAGVRALVEGICQANAITDGEVEVVLKNGKIVKKRRKDLIGKINGLFEKRILTKENAEILHEHRNIGNTALHTLSAPTKEELSLAIEIIEHIFNTLYEIPQKGMQLRSERLKKTKSK